ncbi:MAG: LysR family transcriptional regulator [Acidobacteriaceae bacterium]
MDFDQIATFLEAAKHSSFSRAAVTRCRTPPAISAQMRSRAAEVGGKLFDRSGGKITLTQAGKYFVTFAEQVMALRKQTIDHICELEQTPGGEVVIAANEATFLYVLPGVFSQFKKLYPKVGIVVSRAERARILESVLDNSVDFGVVSMPIRDERITAVKIHEDELLAVIPKGHALSQYKSVSAAQLADFPLLMPKSGNSRDTIDKLFASQQLRPQISMEVDSSELLKHFVAAGLGVSFITRSSAMEEIKSGALQVVPLAGQPIRRDLALIHRKDKSLSRAATAFIDIAVKYKPAPGRY